MDSAKVKAYKAQMQDIFRRAKDRSGFVDWRHMGNLSSGISELIEWARADFSAPEDRWDLFAVANAIFLKWGKTNMDDDGDTAWVMEDVMAAWDDVAKRLVDEKEQKKALANFMKYCDGRVIDYMEDFLYDFMDTHFKSPELLKIKRAFWEDKIKAVKEEENNFLREIHESICENYLLQICADEGMPIEGIERHAEAHRGYKTDDRLLRIYEERGETAREIKLLQDKIAEDGRRSFRSYKCSQYEMKLKDLYKQTGMMEEYRNLLKEMFYMSPSDSKLYDEYRALFTDDGWKEESEKCLFPAVAGTYDALALFQKEKRYDLMMDTAEQLSCSDYEKVLKKYYPERCMKILAKNADTEMERATERKGYRKVARILNKIKKYPEGTALAQELAQKYRKTYPRRPALWEELSRI